MGTLFLLFAGMDVLLYVCIALIFHSRADQQLALTTAWLGFEPVTQRLLYPNPPRTLFGKLPPYSHTFCNEVGITVSFTVKGHLFIPNQNDLWSILNWGVCLQLFTSNENTEKSKWKTKSLIFTYLEANIFQAFPTMLSISFSKNWLLLTKEADFSYLLKALGVFHIWKASWGFSQDVYNAGSRKPPAMGIRQFFLTNEVLPSDFLYMFN